MTLERERVLGELYDRAKERRANLAVLCVDALLPSDDDHYADTELFTRMYVEARQVFAFARATYFAELRARQALEAQVQP